MLPLAGWHCGFECRRGTGCLSPVLLSCLCDVPIARAVEPCKETKMKDPVD
jgi:hypothetical protein